MIISEKKESTPSQGRISMSMESSTEMLFSKWPVSFNNVVLHLSEPVAD